MVDWVAVNKGIERQNQSATAPGNRPDFLTGFLRSAMESVPEMVGLDPSLETERFRAEHPIGGIASTLIPTAASYSGWYKASTKIPAFAKALGSIGVSRAPVISGALREIVRFAPFEAGRVGASALLGGDTSEVAKEAAVNTLLAGAGGGVAGLFRAGGPRVPPAPEISKEVNQQDAITLQLRQLRKARDEGTVTDPVAADYWINQYGKGIREELPPKNVPHVNALEGSKTPPKELNRLFRKGEEPTKSIDRRQFVPQDWTDEVELAGKIKASGLEGQEHFMQFPRYVKPLNTKGTDEVVGAVTNNLAKVGDGIWLGKEADDGLYVVARRFGKAKTVTDVKSKTPFSPNDEWVLFKTDQPERFAPLSAEWTNKIVKNGSFETWQAAKPINTALNQALHQAKDLIGFRNFNDTAPESAWLAAAKKRLGVDRLRGESGQAASQAYNFIREFGAPSTWQFQKNARANYIFQTAKATYDAGRAIASGIMYGSQKLEGKYNVLKNVLLGTRGSKIWAGRPALDGAVDSLFENKRGVFDVWRALNGKWDEARLADATIKGEISPAAAEFLDLLSKTEKGQLQELTRTQKGFGLPTTTLDAESTLGLNTLRGTLRTPILDPKGNLVATASGRNTAELTAEVDALIAGGKERSRNWTKGKYDTANIGDELSALMQKQKMVPGTASDQTLALSLRERFFRAQPDLPWTREELKRTLVDKLHSYQNHMAELNVRNVLGKDFERLSQDDPRIFNQLNQRIDDMSGRQGAVGKGTNVLMDKILAPYLGKDSATKLVAAANEVTHHFTLGLGNTSYPLNNSMGMLQTTLPHVAFVLKATKESIARYYGWGIAAGMNGKAKTGIGFLQPAKIAYQAFKEIGKPSEELLEHFGRAAREGVTDPKIVEEFAGQNSSTVKKLTEAMGGGFLNWVRAVSNFLPAASERWVRTQAFTMGHILGRDFFELEGEKLYTWAKMFTERSQFGYSTVDRARVLSGPMGNMFGLYKNWSMHYMGWLLEYIDQAKQGNMAPLLWMMGGSAAAGGVAASPFYFAADGMARLFADKSAMQLIYENFGPANKGSTYASDGIYYGLPSFLGLSLQGSATAPGADPVRDASMMFNIVQYARMKSLGQGVGAAIDAWEADGKHPIRDRETRDAFIRAFAPRSMYRFTQALGDGVIRSLGTGNSLAHATPAERAWFALGLNPIGVERQMAAANELYKDQAKMKAAVTQYGDLWFQASQRRDSDELHRLMIRAMAAGVPLDSIMRSATSREAKAEDDALDRRFKAEEIAKMSAVAGRRR